MQRLLKVFDEALWRANAFAAEGADITFLEAPDSVEKMQRYCKEVPGIKTANLVEEGRTPWLSPSELTDMGYGIALYPVTLLLRHIAAMKDAASAISESGKLDSNRVSFAQAQSLVGWPEYDAIRAAMDR